MRVDDVTDFQIVEVLPLVEFSLPDDVTDEEACRLIETSSMTSSTIEYRDSMTQSLKLDDDVIKDPFDSGLITYDVRCISSIQ